MGEGKPSFWNCGAVKNEVCDVIDAYQRLKVPKVAEKHVLKTKVHDILSQDLNMSMVCA